MSFNAEQIAAIQGMISDGIQGLRQSMEIEVTQLKTDLAVVDAYAKGLTDRVTTTQGIITQGFEETIKNIETKANENEDKATAGVEKIREVGEQVEKQTSGALSTLGQAADIQAAELEKIKKASQTLQEQVYFMQTGTGNLTREIGDMKTSVGKFLTEKQESMQNNVDAQKVKIDEMMKNGETNMAAQLAGKEARLGALETSMKASLNQLAAELKGGFVAEGGARGGRGFNADGTRQSGLIETKGVVIENIPEEITVGGFKTWRNNLDLHLENFPEFKGSTK